MVAPDACPGKKFREFALGVARNGQPSRKRENAEYVESDLAPLFGGGIGYSRGANIGTRRDGTTVLESKAVARHSLQLRPSNGGKGVTCNYGQLHLGG